MNTHPGLETASAYLNVQMGHTGSPWASRPEGPFVTISRESGAGGSSFARALAQRLNADAPEAERWSVFTGNLIEEMLQANHLSPRLARFLPEDHVSEIAASVGEIVGLHPNLWELVEKTNELMRRLARGGRVILVGRGANFATATISRGIHVRLIASAQHRARHVARLHQTDETIAREFNAKRDAARQRYVRTYFGEQIAEAAAYDMIINTGQVRLSEGADLLAQFVRTRTPAFANAT